MTSRFWFIEVIALSGIFVKTFSKKAESCNNPWLFFPIDFWPEKRHLPWVPTNLHKAENTDNQGSGIFTPFLQQLLHILIKEFVTDAFNDGTH